MKIVIDVPKSWEKCNNTFLRNCIRNGKVLPKGHKRLIEANEELFQSIRQYCGKNATCEVFENAPTIIEADKEVADADSD